MFACPDSIGFFEIIKTHRSRAASAFQPFFFNYSSWHNNRYSPYSLSCICVYIIRAKTTLLLENITVPNKLFRSSLLYAIQAAENNRRSCNITNWASLLALKGLGKQGSQDSSGSTWPTSPWRAASAQQRRCWGALVGGHTKGQQSWWGV